jgi:hypothetical protein
MRTPALRGELQYAKLALDHGNARRGWRWITVMQGLNMVCYELLILVLRM